MSIYASVVALWFMALALFLVGCSIRAWFPRNPDIRVPSLAVPGHQTALSESADLGVEVSKLTWISRSFSNRRARSHSDARSPNTVDRHDCGHEDVLVAETVIAFTEPPRSTTSREFGIASEVARSGAVGTCLIEE
jgi:hypothetical protein